MPGFSRTLYERLLQRYTDDAIQDLERLYQELQDTGMVKDLPPIDTIPLDSSEAVASIEGFKPDRENWFQFAQRVAQSTQNDIDAGNLFMPMWDGKTEEKGTQWAQDCGEMSATQCKAINDHLRVVTPPINSDKVFHLLQLPPTPHLHALETIVKFCCTRPNTFIWERGDADKDPVWRWGASLCVIGGFGLVSAREFAKAMQHYDTDGCWQHWATCPELELAQDIEKAHLTTGYPVGLIRTDFHKMTTIIEAGNPEYTPRWYDALLLTHFAKYARLESQGGPENAFLKLMHRGRHASVPLGPKDFSRSLTASAFNGIIGDVNAVLGLPTIKRGKGENNATYHATRAMMNNIPVQNFPSTINPARLFDLVPSTCVHYVQTFRSHYEPEWIDIGMAACNIARINQDGTVDSDAKVSGPDALNIGWNTPFAFKEADVLSWRRMLPERVTPARPSSFLADYIKNWNTLGHHEGVAAYIDAVLLTDLIRDDLAGTLINDMIRMEFPIFFVMPTGFTEEDTTNQGKTTLARALGQFMAPGIRDIMVLRSSSAPAQRSMAAPIERFGTAVFDEFILPTGFDHFLNQQGIQSLATGGTANPGRAGENSPGISLRHPLSISSKVADLPPDIHNRLCPIFVDKLTEETKISEEKLAFLGGRLAVHMRMAAVQWIRHHRFVETVGAMKPISKGPVRFPGHQAVVSYLLDGNMESIEKYTDAAAAQMGFQREMSDASGLSEAIGIGTQFSINYYFQNCHENTLELLYRQYEASEMTKQPYRTTAAMKLIVGDGEEHKASSVFRDLKTTEHAASIKFSKQVIGKPLHRGDYMLEVVARAKSKYKDWHGLPVPHVIVTKVPKADPQATVNTAPAANPAPHASAPSPSASSAPMPKT